MLRNISPFFVLLVVAFIAGGASKLIGFGYSTDTGTRSGGVLSDTQRATVNAAIALLANSGQFEYSDGLSDMNAAGVDEINLEENENANKGTGNSADATGTDRGGFTVHSKRFNIGKETMQNAVDGKDGAIGRLAGVLVHELWHIDTPKPNNNEMSARLAQASALCGIICLGAEGGLTPEDITELCEQWTDAIFYGAMSRPVNQSLDSYLAATGSCPCCPNSVAAPQVPSAPITPELAAVAAGIPSGFNPRMAVYQPTVGQASDRFYSVFSEPAPYLRVDYVDSLSGQDSSSFFTLNFIPTAMTGDGEDMVYVGGKDLAGKSVVKQIFFSYASGGVTMLGPTEIFSSSKVDLVSDLVYSLELGIPRLYALDGVKGQLGFLNISTGALSILASASSNPQMVNWRSFLIGNPPAIPGNVIELSRKFPMDDFYEFDEELYLIVDNDLDGNPEQSYPILAQFIAFPD